jgi:tetratricopeptide (TPR) repeat protein
MRKNSYLRLLTYFLLLIVLSAPGSEVQAQRKKDLEKARKIAKQGDQFFNQKNYREAINRYAEAIALVPNFAAAHYWKGFAHYNLQEFDQAVIDWDSALSQGYDKPLDIYKVRWYLNYQGKNYDAALKDALAAAQLDPNNALYNLALGDIYRQKENYAEAVNAYKKAAQQDPANPDVHYFIAFCYASLNNPVEQGLAALEAIKKNTKYQAESHFYVADALGRTKKFDEAIEYYDKAIELNPKIYGAYGALADIYRSRNRFEDAIEVTNKGLRQYPTDSDFYTSLSWYYSLADRHIEAINAAKAAINLAPDRYMAYTNLCRAYNDTKQYEVALQNCNNALRINPNDGETYLYMARAYALTKQPDKATESYKKALDGLLRSTREQPDYSDGFYLLGNAYLGLQRDMEAIEAYKKCLALAPRFARARYTLGFAYMENKKTALAREQYNLLKDIDPNWAEKLRQVIEGK